MVELVKYTVSGATPWFGARVKDAARTVTALVSVAVLSPLPLVTVRLTV